MRSRRRRHSTVRGPADHRRVARRLRSAWCRESLPLVLASPSASRGIVLRGGVARWWWSGSRTAGLLREGSCGERLSASVGAANGDDGCDASETGKPRRATGMEGRQRQTMTTYARTEQDLEVERDLVGARNAARNGMRVTACSDAGAAVRVEKALEGRASVGKWCRGHEAMVRQMRKPGEPQGR